MARWKAADVSAYWCPRPDCRDYRKKAASNLKVNAHYGKHGDLRQLYCKTCRRTFSERYNNDPFYPLRLPAGKILEILDEVTRGASVRVAADAVGVNRNTVANVLGVAREDARKFRDGLIDVLDVEPVRAEAIYEHLRARNQMKRGQRPPGWNPTREQDLAKRPRK